MALQKTNSKQSSRTDETIQDEIWRSLWNEETIQSIDVNDISVNVENGQVCFFGHVLKDYIYQRIEEITKSIPGVVAVHNHLVTDPDLSIQVAQALRNYETTRHLLLQVYSNNGWVELVGSVPNRELQSAAEATAARVPAVRGVIRIPEIEGEQSATIRLMVQPRIGVRVFEKEETKGVIYQVVITPQNRLVSHAIVRVNRKSNGWQEFDQLSNTGRCHGCGGCKRYFLEQSRTSNPSVPGFRPLKLSLCSAYLAAPFPLCGWQRTLAYYGIGERQSVQKRKNEKNYDLEQNQ